MGRYKSFIQLRGKVGDIVYRRMKGKNFIGLMTGPTKHQVLTAPEFINTRKNMQEFGQTLLYLNEVIKEIYDSQIKITTKIKRKQIFKIIFKSRLNDIINEFGKRTINATPDLKDLILEKKGNFNFDFIEIKELMLLNQGGKAVAQLTFKDKEILKYMPDNNKKWYIKTSLRVLCVGRKIFNTNYNRYLSFRRPLTKDINWEQSCYVNEKYNMSKFAFSSVNLPINTPFIDNEDMFIIVMQHILIKKNEDNISYKYTENYITKILNCTEIDII